MLCCIYTYCVHVCTKTCFAHITCQIFFTSSPRISCGSSGSPGLNVKKHVDFFSRSFRMRSRKRLQRRTRPRRMIVIPLMKSPKRRHQIVTDLKFQEISNIPLEHTPDPPLPVYEGNPFIFVFWDTWGMFQGSVGISLDKCLLCFFFSHTCFEEES